MLGRPREGARIALDRLEELARLGIERSYGNALAANAAEALHALGEWDQAEAVARRALALGAEVQRYSALMADTWVAIGRGELERARECLQAGAQTAASDLRVWLQYVAPRSRPGAAGGPPRQGAHGARQGACRRDRTGSRVAARRAVRARFARRRRERGARPRSTDAGALDDVRRHADAVLADARAAADEAATVIPIAAGWRALAEAERTRVTGPAQPGAWATAAEVWQRLEQPSRVAYCQRWQAEALVAAGAPRSAAQASALEAYTVATRLGALPLRREAELLGERAGMSSPPT